MNSRRLLRFAEDVVATIMDLRPTRATDAQAEAAKALATRLQVLAASNDLGEGSPFWQDTCRRLAELAAQNDPLFFMRWPPIRATMVHGATLPIIADWWRLRRSPAWRGTWRNALRHPQYGHPPPFLPMLSTNAMAVEHAKHLATFHAHTGRAFHAAATIIEFGGGYGSMCRMIHALGFRGTYIIFDLPPILELQRYYLGLHGIDAGPGPASTVRLCATLDEVAGSLAARPQGPIAAISTWALSEMPIDLRARIEPFLRHPDVVQVLLAYQAHFEGTDNFAWFSGLAERTAPHLRWDHIPEHAIDRDVATSPNNYLFGLRPS